MRTTVAANPDASIESSFYQFYNENANFKKLKRWNLRLDPCYCPPAHKNCILRASKDNNQYCQACRDLNKCDDAALGHSRFYCQQLQLCSNLKLFLIIMLFLKDYETAINRLYPADKWSNMNRKHYNQSWSPSFCLLQREWLGKMVTDSWICL